MFTERKKIGTNDKEIIYNYLIVITRHSNAKVNVIIQP